MARKRKAKKQRKQEDFHELKRQSKEEFMKEYEKHDESSAKNVYLQVLFDLEKSIATGNVNYFKYLSNIIDNINSVETEVRIKTFYGDSDNPLKNTNLVILACKYNQPAILKHIFKNEKNFRILSFHKDCAISPNDEDETCHNALYYAIRSGNIELLELLFGWTENFFSGDLDELHEFFSKTYEELKLRNIPLTEIMELSVEEMLINMRFYSYNSEQNKIVANNLNNIKKRMDLVLQKINLLMTDYLNAEVDEKFLFVLKFIPENIHVLKQQLKYSYDRLPWEEMEFCLICFVSSHTKIQEINLFYHATLDRNRMLQHLKIFAKKMEEVEVSLKSEDIKNKGVPNSKRGKIIANIIKINPEFEELYKDYHYIRDFYSLEKISNHINLSLSVDPGDKQGQLILIRVLQFIGEYSKNTPESPKLSDSTSDLLLLSLSKNTRKIITDLRNLLSHADSLFKRTEIEQKSNTEFFGGVQNDLKKIGDTITGILYSYKIKLIKTLLKKIVESEKIEEITKAVKALKYVKLEKMVSRNFQTMEHAKLESLIKELSRCVTNKTDFEEKLFSEIIQKLDFENSKIQNIEEDYVRSFLSLKSLHVMLNDNDKIDHNTIRGIKFRGKVALKNISPQIESHSVKEIADLSMTLFDSVTAREHGENFEKIQSLFYEIFFIAKFQTGDIKWIKKFNISLNEDENFSISKRKQRKFRDIKKTKKCLELKLSELKSILRDDLSTEMICSHKTNKKQQAIIEILLLDIMSLVDIISEDYLANNQFFIDDYYPSLTGRCLRNHLAHDNILFDISLFDPLTAIILNAKIFAKKEVESIKQIGKIITDDPDELSKKYKRRFEIIDFQKKMFTALEDGNIEQLKDCLKKGADISARSINSSTPLHYAAKCQSLEIIKFILKQNAEVNVNDQNGQNPLHIAAAYGNATVLEYLIKEVGFPIQSVDNNLKTPLHIAAQKGHKDAVQVLLKYKADRSLKDISGILPLHHAIRNNHFHIAKILIGENANIDINETMGGFTPLHEAAEFGHLEIVTFLLQNGADVNAKNDRNWTPLHAAALNGHLDIVKALINQGANVNVRVIDGCTPLHYALENGHEEIANVLLSHGAKVNVFDKTYHNTPLHYAAEDGYEIIVNTLLKHGADATASTTEGLTPLHFAARSGHLKIVASLLKYRADIHAKDINNATPMHYAAVCGQKEVVAFLIEQGATVDDKDVNYCTPLYIAADRGHIEVVNLLIEHNANIKTKDTKGNSVLHAVARHDKSTKDMIDILIKNGAEINACNNDGMVPLHIAAIEGCEKAVSSFIENKAEVNVIATSGFTPLHFAIINKNKNIVELLLKNGADMNIRSKNGETSFNIAVEIGCEEIVEVLILNGADVNKKSGNNFTTPLHTAVKNNCAKIVEILVNNGADINDKADGPLAFAVLAGYKDIVEIFIKHGAQLNIVDDENTTLLHIAAKTGHKEIVKKLIEKGIDVNVKNINNITPLYMAAQEGHEDIVEFLIAKEADLHVTPNDGLTPLHAAAAYGHNNAVHTLLENGANMNIKDRKNRTPLELAVARGHLKVVKILLQSKKTSINAKGNDDWTLLHIAAQGNNLEIIKYLVNNGADVNSKNASGSKPMHIAAREGFKEAVEFFLSNGCDVNDLGAFNQTLLHYAVMNNKSNPNVVQFLIDQGANVNVQDKNGLSPMHIAAKFGSIDIVKILLKNGAAYNSVDNSNRKPLDMATQSDIFDYLIRITTFFESAKNNSLPEVRQHIKSGIVVDVRNTSGATPLHYVSWKGYEEILKVLLQNDANPNALENKRLTPLHYAAKFSHINIVKILLSYGAVFNAVSDSGKMPSDFSTDESIVNLFKLISNSFEKIRNRNSKVIYDLKKIEDVDTVRAVMSACNKEKETLITAAIRCHFPKTEQLKDILQDGASDDVKMALMLARDGDYHVALSILYKVYRKKEFILGSNNPSTLEIERHIATVLYKQGNYKEASEKLEEIYQKQKEILGLKNEETLNTRSLFALVLHRQGRDEEASKIYKEVYQIQKELIGPNHPDTLNTLFHSALVLDALGEHEEALNINKKLYEQRKRHLGANNPQTIAAQNNIAMVLVKQGKYEQSLNIYKDVLEKKKLIYGLYHTDTLRTLRSIATILAKQNKGQEALEVSQEIFSIQKKLLGPNNPETLKTQYQLGSLFFEQGKYANAFSIFTECLESIKDVFGPSSVIVLDISRKMEMIKYRFKLEGSESSNILHYMQDDIKIAVVNGDKSRVIRLLEERFNVNEKDSDGITLLHYAVSYEHLDIVTILLKEGADIFQTTNKGITPLHTAVTKNNSEITKILLQHVTHNKLNGFINAKTISGGTTALHVAAKNGYMNIVIILLQYGAVYDAQNKDGKTPLDLSITQNVTNLLQLLEDLFNYAKNADEIIIEKLKLLHQDEFSAVTNAHNSQGNTILQVLKKKKHSKIIQKKLSELIKNNGLKV